MSVLEAILLGIIQGLTEFLPVSSSGHIELGKAILGIELENDLLFSLLVHLATVLSIFIVFGKDIWGLLKNLFTFKWNEGNKYIAKLALSALPVMVVGLAFKEQLELLFEGRIVLVGALLICTGFILYLSTLEKEKTRKFKFLDALIVGLAQAVAVLPGISRSGSTIATALALGIDREDAARFSFLMVLVPIIGASLLELPELANIQSSGNAAFMPLLAGFIAAFVSGYLACRWMLNVVKKGKITYFSIYCFIVGAIAIATGLLR